MSDDNNRDKCYKRVLARDNETNYNKQQQAPFLAPRRMATWRMETAESTTVNSQLLVEATTSIIIIIFANQLTTVL